MPFQLWTKLKPGHRNTLWTLFACVFLVAAALQPAHAFDNFYGTWSGSGNAIFSGGAREALLCKGYYTGEKTALNLALRCASRDNRIDLRAKLTSEGGQVSGQWEERTFNAAGTVAGTHAGNQLAFKLTGGITGTMKVSLTDNTQLVSINADHGALDGVQLKLKRRK